MNKEMSAAVVCFILWASVLSVTPLAFADEEMPSGNEGGGNVEGMDRGLERAGQPKKDALTAWGEYFFGKPVDPLDAQSMEKYQQGKEERDKRVQAGAEFTQAATSLVSAGTPSPTVGSTVGTVAIGEATGAVVNAGTTPPAEEPGAFQRFVNWIASWFK